MTAVADALVSSGGTVTADGLMAPTGTYKMVVGAYGWWRLVNRTSQAGVIGLLLRGYPPASAGGGNEAPAEQGGKSRFAARADRRPPPTARSTHQIDAAVCEL
ncbi:hypothetical protein GCM10010350_84670 [Streptomyces galilaeus]|nr:hypothetical protein GCM10010350_84670 [Streptomyces galilaeus]